MGNEFLDLATLFHGQALPLPPDNKNFFTEESFAENHLKGGERILSRVDVLWRIARWGDGGGRTSMEGRTTTTTMVGRTTTTTSMVGRGAMVAELGRRLVLRLGSHLLIMREES